MYKTLVHETDVIDDCTFGHFFQPRHLKAQTELTDQQAKKWFDKKEWLQGLSLTTPCIYR